MDRESDLVELRPVNRGNWRQCTKLRVAPEQTGLICDNAVSLAEAGVRDEATPLAIYANGEMIGLIVYLKDPDTGDYYIHRFMIDQRWQGRRYGKSALYECIRLIAGLADFNGNIYIMFLEWNEHAERLYASVGFQDTGTRSGSEKVFILTLPVVLPVPS
jgi:diamine N-acetyltransferase